MPHTGGNPVYVLANTSVGRAKDPDLASFKRMLGKLKRMNDPNLNESRMRLIEMCNIEIAKCKAAAKAPKQTAKTTKVRKQTAKTTKIQKQKKGKKSVGRHPKCDHLID